MYVRLSLYKFELNAEMVSEGKLVVPENNDTILNIGNKGLYTSETQLENDLKALIFDPFDPRVCYFKDLY